MACRCLWRALQWFLSITPESLSSPSDAASQRMSITDESPVHPAHLPMIPIDRHDVVLSRFGHSSSHAQGRPGRVFLRKLRVRGRERDIASNLQR